MDGGYWYFKKRSCGQRILNLASLFSKKGRIAGRNIVVIVLGSLLVLLGITNIVLQSYHFLICQ